MRRSPWWDARWPWWPTSSPPSSWAWSPTAWCWPPPRRARPCCAPSTPTSPRVPRSSNAHLNAEIAETAERSLGRVISAPSAVSAFKKALMPALAAATALGCPGSRKPVVYDLVERSIVADRWSAREVLLFGTPAAEPHQADGFYREGAVPEGDPFVWARGEAEVSLTWPDVRERAAVVD